ncbi:MAG: type II secretion system F family protein [Deltaproteobacteria bacterium]|nr:MAG: type II secretion system F family protein [Deltaproteobacteria bacterium]
MANDRKNSRSQSNDSLEVNLREIVKQKLQEERATEILENNQAVTFNVSDEDIESAASNARSKIPAQVLAQYFREMAVLLEAGFPVLRALRIAGRGKTSPLMSAALTKVANQVENGTALWRAMQSHPRIFPYLAVSVVRAGEASGTLDEAMVYLADSLEYEADVRLKVRSAFDYPIFFSGLTLAVVAAMIFLVLPRFQDVYRNLSAIKKVSSQGFEFLLAVRAVFPWVLLFGGIGVFLLWTLFRSRSIMALEKLKLRIPIFGKLLVYSDMTRFAKTLSVQVKSSVPILDALRLSRLVVNNRELQKMVHEIRLSAEQGGQLAEPVRKYSIVPDTVVDMIEVGEESGSLDNSLEHLAKMMGTKMESIISRLTALLQPILLLVMGTIVVGIFVMMITPYFQVLDAVQSMGLQPMGSDPAIEASTNNKRRRPSVRKRRPARRTAPAPSRSKASNTKTGVQTDKKVTPMKAPAPRQR